MSTVTVHRAFRTRSHVIYESDFNDMSLMVIENAQTLYINWMLQIPTIFTKDASAILADELSALPYNHSLECLIITLEAYPKSFHNGAVPELGILVSFNHAFKVGGNERHRNWRYKECDIVDKNGWRHVYIEDLPKKIATRTTDSIENFQVAQRNWRSRFA